MNFKRHISTGMTKSNIINAEPEGHLYRGSPRHTLVKLQPSTTAKSVWSLAEIEVSYHSVLRAKRSLRSIISSMPCGCLEFSSRG